MPDLLLAFPGDRRMKNRRTPNLGVLSVSALVHAMDMKPQRHAPTAPHLVSTGMLASLLQVGLGEVQDVLRELRARPALTLNGIPYFEERSVVNRLRKRLNAVATA